MQVAVPPDPPSEEILVTARALPDPAADRAFMVDLLDAAHLRNARSTQLDQVLKDVPGLQLFRRSNRIIYRYEIEEGPKVYESEFHGKPFTLFDDTVIAFGAKGEELFRTKVEEPFHVRPDKHINWV